MTEAFYLPLGAGRYLPTGATTSPWDDGAQHGGPPTALLATAIDRAGGAPGLRLARVTAELLGPIPRRELLVEAAVTRPGRRVVMTEATLSVDGRPAVVARAWHVAVGTTAPPAAGGDGAPGRPEPVPGEQPQVYFPGLDPSWGYGRAIDWRFTQGGWDRPGPARVWTRVRLPLIAGEPLTGYQRALIVADAANGLSNHLPITEWLFIPPSVTVHLQRHPAGEWVHLACHTATGEDGIGLTTGTIADAGGPVGALDQPLLVAPRHPG